MEVGGAGLSEQNGGQPVPGEMQQVIPGPIVTELGRLVAVNAMLAAENAALREQLAAALWRQEVPAADQTTGGG
jgi:hypothetical protein